MISRAVPRTTALKEPGETRLRALNVHASGHERENVYIRRNESLPHPAELLASVMTDCLPGTDCSNGSCGCHQQKDLKL